MVQPKKSFGSLLQHFTGSKAHNILLRKHALDLGYSVSEYGIKNIHSGEITTFEKEEDVYKFLKLKFVEPNKRVGESELESLQK